MPTVQVEADLPAEVLLKAVEQLNEQELDQFVDRVLVLQAQRKAPSLVKDEAELLQKINQRLPDSLQSQYDHLIAKRKNETLTPEEHTTLLNLTEQVEQFEAERIDHLAELAHLRQISLTDLMVALQIQPPTYD
jgi:hypothetical protein